MRYLIHTGPGIGDIIQFLSMARAIKEKYKDARIDLIMRGNEQTKKLNDQILACQRYVDNLYWYSSKELLHDIALISTLRKNKYDFGIVRVGNVTGETSLWIYRIMRLAKCKQVVGTGTEKVDIVVKVPERSHYLIRNDLLLRATGIEGRKNASSIDYKLLDWEWYQSLGIPKESKIIGLSLGTNSMMWREGDKTITYDVKSWKLERWFELAELLTKKDYWVLLIGGKKEKEEIIEKGISNCSNSKIINLVGQTSIKESLTAISQCCLMVGSEGGMMHCASALDIKTLTIMGGSDYKMWNPGGSDSPMMIHHMECQPCFCTSRGAHCKTHECLESISVKSVSNKIDEILQMQIMKD